VCVEGACVRVRVRACVAVRAGRGRPHPIPPGQNEHAVGICQIAQLKKVKL